MKKYQFLYSATLNPVGKVLNMNVYSRWSL